MKYSIHLKEKKILFLSFFFLLSFIVSLIFLYFERKIIGLSSTYHPDASLYLNSFKVYNYLSFDFSFLQNLKNFTNLNNLFSGSLYYSISNLFHELQTILYSNFNLNFNAYRGLIILNIFIFCLTNLLILNFFIKKNKNHDLKVLFVILIFCFLPYKIHLSINVLKESIILFFLILHLFYSNMYIFIISFLFGTSIRGMYSLYFLNFFDFKNFFVKRNFFIFISVLITFFFIISNFFLLDDITISFSKFINQRNSADMGGRNYDNIPNFIEYGNFGTLLRLIVWPIFILSGLFVFFSDNFFLYVLGIEIIVLQITLFYCNKRFLLSLGLLLFLCFLAIYVNSFTAYFRYGYIAIQIVFLKKLLKI